MKRSPLTRKTPLGRKPRAKGNRGELEVREALRVRGYHSAKRNLQSGGQGGGDLIEAIPGYSIEVKRVENLNVWKALAQAEAAAAATETPVVVFRRNNGSWWAVLDRDARLELFSGGPLYHLRAWERQNIRLWVEIAKTVAEAPRDAVPVLDIKRPESKWYSVLPFDAFLDAVVARA